MAVDERMYSWRQHLLDGAVCQYAYKMHSRRTHAGVTHVVSVSFDLARNQVLEVSTMVKIAAGHGPRVVANKCAMGSRIIARSTFKPMSC